MSRLANKTAVITGGTTGLGFETAKLFIAEGARVLFTGQNPERLEKAAKELGPRATAVRADARSVPDLRALADRAKAELGRVDVLFANAGIAQFAPLDVLDEKHFDDQFNTNVKGLFFTVKLLAPLVPDGGSVILNASAVNAKGMAGGSVYFATKAAVRSLARSFAAELGARSVRVNALSPGLVPTDIQGKMGLPKEQLDGFEQGLVSQLAIKRVGRPAEIARAALFLASEESSYVTAADIVVDGGFMNL